MEDNDTNEAHYIDVLQCEWQGCNSLLENNIQLHDHIIDHGSNVDKFVCGICNCVLWDFESNEPLDLPSIERHLHYHAWKIHLRAQGTKYQFKRGLPSCNHLVSDRNLVPLIPDQFRCLWEFCDFKTNHISLFFLHVSEHMSDAKIHKIGDESEHDKLKCEWAECIHKTTRVHCLKTHLSTHTGEKLVACPVCSTPFSTFSKFEDHLLRQTVGSEDFKCSRCQRAFSSKRLLNQHMNLHINNVKCPMCNMVLHDKWSLQRHIQWKHSEERPFQCGFCNFATKSEQSLVSHLTKMHRCENEDNYKKSTSSNTVQEKVRIDKDYEHLDNETRTCCKYCDKKYRSVRALNVHNTKMHAPSNTAEYQCHLCERRFRRGQLLTHHLMSHHKLQKASTSCQRRFQYILDPETGFFKLQTTRLNSIRLACELLGEKNVNKLILKKEHSVIL